MPKFAPFISCDEIFFSKPRVINRPFSFFAFSKFKIFSLLLNYFLFKLGKKLIDV